MRVGIAADHAGFTVKEELSEELKAFGCEVIDFGAHTLNLDDDYPDFVVPLARAVANQEVERGIAICGSSIGACIAANKVPGVRAGPCSDYYSAHQGVEHDNTGLAREVADPTGWAKEKTLACRIANSCCCKNHSILYHSNR